MIDRIANVTVANTARASSVEKVTPSPQIQDVNKQTEKQNEKSQQELPKDKIEEVVKGINDFIQPVNTSIRFVLHDRLNDYYVTVIDDKTAEVIKEIPSKKLMDTYADMLEFVGLLVDKKI